MRILILQLPNSCKTDSQVKISGALKKFIADGKYQYFYGICRTHEKSDLENHKLEIYSKAFADIVDLDYVNSLNRNRALYAAINDIVEKLNDETIKRSDNGETPVVDFIDASTDDPEAASKALNYLKNTYLLPELVNNLRAYSLQDISRITSQRHPNSLSESTARALVPNRNSISLQQSSINPNARLTRRHKSRGSNRSMPDKIEGFVLRPAALGRYNSVPAIQSLEPNPSSNLNMPLENSSASEAHINSAPNRVKPLMRSSAVHALMERTYPSISSDGPWSPTSLDIERKQSEQNEEALPKRTGTLSSRAWGNENKRDYAGSRLRRYLTSRSSRVAPSTTTPGLLFSNPRSEQTFDLNVLDEQVQGQVQGQGQVQEQVQEQKSNASPNPKTSSCCSIQ